MLMLDVPMPSLPPLTSRTCQQDWVWPAGCQFLLSSPPHRLHHHHQHRWLTRWSVVSSQQRSCPYAGAVIAWECLQCVCCEESCWWCRHRTYYSSRPLSTDDCSQSGPGPLCSATTATTNTLRLLTSSHLTRYTYTPPA